jgi:hypothetical protein
VQLQVFNVRQRTDTMTAFSLDSSPNWGCPMSTARFSSGTPSTPLWQVLYEDAILEFDDAKLPERILRARDSIHVRTKEILTDSSERHRLDNALQTLQILEEIAARVQSAQKERLLRKMSA